MSRISIIAAIGQNRELGKENKLLWHIPGELPRFKRITTGHPIIMGRKTYESIGRVLPQRTNIIITRDKALSVEGAEIVHSLDEALALARTKSGNDEIFVIGGGQIFEQALPLTDRLYLTLVRASFDADTFFPSFEDAFTKVIEKEAQKSEEYSYTFMTLER